MGALALRDARPDELEALVALNRQLLEDEGAGPLDDETLHRRMAGWLADPAWHPAFFEQDGRIVGYALWHRQPGTAHVHLRQFLIDRPHRRQGLGRRAIACLVAAACRPGDRLTLDVLNSNPGGLAFWQAMGFQPYATSMQRFF